MMSGINSLSGRPNFTGFLVFLNLNIPCGHATLKQRRINVDTTSGRCMDVDATLHKRQVSAG